jgi:hypothetical protein
MWVCAAEEEVVGDNGIVRKEFAAAEGEAIGKGGV